MLAARLLARDLRWDLACAEGVHLRAEGVELAIVLHCMNEHGARAPPWRLEASCDLSIAGRIACRACCLIRKGGTPGDVRPCPTASQPTGPALRSGRGEPLVAAPAAQQWPNGDLDHHHPRRFMR